jgi:hypothetical protein
MSAHMNSWDKSPGDSLTIEHHPLHGVTYALTIYASDGVDLDRSLMAQWIGKLGFDLQPLADYVLEKIKQGERIFADETTTAGLYT